MATKQHLSFIGLFAALVLSAAAAPAYAANAGGGDTPAQTPGGEAGVPPAVQPPGPSPQSQSVIVPDRNVGGLTREGDAPQTNDKEHIDRSVGGLTREGTEVPTKQQEKPEQ